MTDTNTIINDPNSLSTDPGDGVGVTFDIDKIFGSPSDKEKVGDDLTEPGTDVFADVKNNRSGNKQDNFPRNPEEVLKKLQSERDREKAQREKLEAEANDWRSAHDFLIALREDEEVRKAFIAELEPDLFKQKTDPYALIQERLKAEFGSDFVPNPEESGIFGSRTWLYNQRATDLLNEYKQQQSKMPKSIKEIAEKRKQQQEQEIAAAKKEKQDVLEKLKWNDQTWNSFTKWMKSSKTEDFAKIFDYMQRRSGAAPRPLATRPGSSNINFDNTHISHLRDFFG